MIKFPCYYELGTSVYLFVSETKGVHVDRPLDGEYFSHQRAKIEEIDHPCWMELCKDIGTPTSKKHFAEALKQVTEIIESYYSPELKESFETV